MMKRFATRGMLGLAVLAMLGSTLTPFYAQGITYRIDPVHSTVIFRVKHM
ncbi:protein yceI precursor, partial [Escherichia coli]|nr:protein yceI precursor [Escherichia coli]